MSDTCIVCLGDLSTGSDGDTAPSNALAKSPSTATIDADDNLTVNNNVGGLPTIVNGQVDTDNTPELIAHLQPCGHDLHNECLKPWVERANSCPICRANFHMVELLYHIGGPVVSSYAVEDKTQVAELDPSMFLEVPDEAIEEEVCQSCGEGDHEDVLVYCDGCDKLWHTYCVELDDVPFGAWFCDRCSAERQTHLYAGVTQRSRNAVGRRRTRGMERRRRTHRNTNDDGWNNVWQSVWSRINLDLDFPFEDDETPATVMRRHRQSVEAHRREHQAWERRMRVAELANAGRQFRETETTLLSNDLTASSHQNRRAAPQRSAEEIAAWEAFDEASDKPAEPIQPESSTSRKRKRGSRDSSPAAAHNATRSQPPNRASSLSSPQSQPEGTNTARLPKRQRQGAPVSNAASKSASPTRSSPIRPLSPRRRPQFHAESAAPSFLQSLLQEVEDSSGHALHRPSPRFVGSPPAEQYSPRPSSPATSNPSSPRALSTTPPPTFSTLRPSSPGLTSSIQPVFPAIDYSPQRSESSDQKETAVENTTANPASRASPTNLARPKPRRARVPDIVLDSIQPRSRSNDTSPTRVTLSATNKADVQKLVSSALKPHYHEQKISKDEYTNINRDVSRMLYDKIGDFEALDVEGRAKWEKVAGEEVDKAVVALRATAV